MAGNYNNIDIAPIQQCLLNISGSDTNRGISFLDEPFHPIQMDWTFDAQNSSLYPQIKFAQVTNGMKGMTEAVVAAQTVPIPATLPPISVPPIPPYPSPIQGKTYTWIVNPTVGGYPGPHIPGTMPIKQIDAAAFNTSVTFNIEQRNPVGSPGTDIMSSDLTADSSAERVMSFANPVLIKDNWLWLDISAVSASGTSAQFVVTLETIL